MRNYVILNGVNSLTKQGLAINEMPPISKPLMRTQKEEIDGKDGDIITNLGYSAYDKAIEIGLYGESYDINDIIAFFNDNGTVVFSDEPDKYYNYQIINQIDYDKLIKFKTATVVFHCQPFKYPLNETPQEEEFEYVSGSGTNITLDNTAESTFNTFDLKGNTSQDGTPTPDAPIPVNVVTGYNKINVVGKNLFDKDKVVLGKVWNGTSNTKRAYGYIEAVQGQQYTISCNNSNSDLAIYVVETTTIGETGTNVRQVTLTNSTPQTFIPQTNTKYIAIQFATTNNNTTQEIIDNAYVMIEKGSEATAYEPYKEDSYEINLGKNLFDGEVELGSINTSGNVSTNNALRSTNYIKVKPSTQYTISNDLDYTTRIYEYNSSKTYVTNSSQTSTTYTFTTSSTTEYIRFRTLEGSTQNNLNVKVMLEEGNQATSYAPYFTPIEMCKIGDYQDYFYKENNTWYIHKEIGKVDLSTLSWTGGGTYSYNKSVPNIKYTNNNQEIGIGKADNYQLRQGSGMSASTWYGYMAIDTAQITINPSNATKNAAGDFYYALATATDEEITNELLISQLDALEQANSQAGQTNIIQVNSDLPFIVDVIALKLNSDHLIINNIGNIYSKPTLDLEGTGIVDIYLNDIQMFQVDLSEVNEIVINTAEMEAYNPTTMELANRQVTGDYSNFKLAVGENDLRFSGNLTKATITNYQRWL